LARSLIILQYLFKTIMIFKNQKKQFKFRTITLKKKIV
jgi:hypothetical protein